MTTNYPMSQPADLDRPRRKLIFDPTVNLGHVISVATFVALGIAAWSNFDKRQSIAEVQIVEGRARVEEQERRWKEGMGELKTEIKDLRQAVTALNGILTITSQQKK